MRIFVTGAAGYIGGAVAARLLDDGHQVVGLVRSPEKAAALREWGRGRGQGEGEGRGGGIEPLIGTLDDAALLADAARGADAVIDAASADHAGAARALIDALAGSNKRLIHTSGSSIVGDRAAGASSGKVYDEATRPEPLPEKAARVAIDRAVVDAAARGVHGIVLCPTMIYGKGRGLHQDSIQVPWMIALARESGVAKHIGAGLNVWSHVHIDDLADAYALALDRAPAGSFYFVEQGEASYRAIAEAITRALGYTRGPEPWPIEEAIAKWGEEAAKFAFGSNSRVRADKLRQTLGWSPNGPALLDEIARVSAT